jgi:hypothetical protein
MTKQCADLGQLSRPLDTSAARFLSRFIQGYLKQNGFFGFASYHEVTLKEALVALTTHFPGMADPDKLMTKPHLDRTMTGTDTTESAAPLQDVYEYTIDEHTIYKKIKEEATTSTSFRSPRKCNKMLIISAMRQSLMPS